MTHPLEVNAADYNAAAKAPPFSSTPKIVDSGADQPTPPRKPRIDRFAIVKWYFRGLWVIAILMIYMVVVEIQVAGAMHALLLANGQITANNMVIIHPIRYPGQTFCMYMTPQSVSLNTMIFASDPLHWGPPLYSYLNTTYCNRTISELNVKTYIVHTGGGPPPPPLIVPANSFINAST